LDKTLGIKCQKRRIDKKNERRMQMREDTESLLSKEVAVLVNGNYQDI